MILSWAVFIAILGGGLQTPVGVSAFSNASSWEVRSQLNLPGAQNGEVQTTRSVH